MKKFAAALLFAIPLALFARVAYLLWLAPSSDPATVDLQFRQAAYAMTWGIQLSYLAWLGFKWRSQKRESERLGAAERTGKSPVC